jgi:pimeloyl-ACP methyl ester carboxylesterase
MHNAGAGLKQVTCPVHVVTGTHDLVIPAVNSRRIAKLIPHATLEELENVGHAVPVQDPDVVLRSVRRLLEAARRTAA